jgi:hypothetical protein
MITFPRAMDEISALSCKFKGQIVFNDHPPSLTRSDDFQMVLNENPRRCFGNENCMWTGSLSPPEY